ncbi:methyltransferase domain-containing protein [Nannocystis sp. RBIL2]|uniref:class I SAM-dependent methyltransferase n=1 Tax=Nannocystis sp. RBIL2 TaxID=2996788 RepID=UPI0022716667|nr:methyltransferase domain-containing protein [Nannocystis sp. RBIL2]MCY1071951.1 methyltransferase domain-containing protein [Nannocystis sp. RBIL2]
MTPEQTEHRVFLNRYYRAARPIYDVTRKYYLFGRDRALEGLLAAPWASLVEVGPGTGRNLEILQRRRAWALYGGIEAADAMLERAAARCPWAHFQRAFAEDADYAAVLGAPPQRIFFSYCLSMVQRREEALQHALSQVAPGGEVHVVDFADLRGLPRPLAAGLRAWLELYRVTPLEPGWLAGLGADMVLGPGRYYVLARLRRPQ